MDWNLEAKQHSNFEESNNFWEYIYLYMVKSQINWSWSNKWQISVLLIRLPNIKQLVVFPFERTVQNSFFFLTFGSVHFISFHIHYYYITISSLLSCYQLKRTNNPNMAWHAKVLLENTSYFSSSHSFTLHFQTHNELFSKLSPHGLFYFIQHQNPFPIVSISLQQHHQPRYVSISHYCIAGCLSNPHL